MTARYEGGFVKNVFQHLDIDSSLCILGLCLASHDIVLNHSLIGNSKDEERSYHFAASLSVLREAAKIIKRIDNLAFAKHFSRETKDMLDDLKRNLGFFHGNSLINGRLRPIRNLTFHYDFSKADKDRIKSLLAEIMKEPKLKVRARSGDNSILRSRYTFADAFRSQLVDSYLTKAITDQISLATMDLIAFTESLLFDLSQ